MPFTQKEKKLGHFATPHRLHLVKIGVNLGSALMLWCMKDGFKSLYPLKDIVCEVASLFHSK